MLCTPFEMAEQVGKKKKSALQIIKSSPLYRNVSGRLSLNEKRPKSEGLMPNGGPFPKQELRRPKEEAGLSSPSDDDGGFATWSGSCDRLAQIRDIIRKRSEAIERVSKSQSAYTLPQDMTKEREVFLTSSPARPTSLPNQSRKNDAWVPPEPDPDDSPKLRHSDEYNRAIASFPFYTPPAPISRNGTLVSSCHRPQTVATPAVRPGGHLSRNPARPHSVAGPLDVRPVENGKTRPHSVAGVDRDWSPVQMRTTPATSATSPSDSGYRSLPSAASDYQIKSPSVVNVQTTYNSLPANYRRFSLPAAGRCTTAPRPSPTFHGLPFRPVGCHLPASGLPLPPSAPRAPANTPTKAQFAYARTLNHLDDKITLLFDILDTQERFAKVNQPTKFEPK